MKIFWRLLINGVDLEIESSYKPFYILDPAKPHFISRGISETYDNYRLYLT